MSSQKLLYVNSSGDIQEISNFAIMSPGSAGANQVTADETNGLVIKLGAVGHDQLETSVVALLDFKFVRQFTDLTGFPLTGLSNTLYVDETNQKTYAWVSGTYALVGSSLQLGETSSTTYRGDRGKTAYDHSQVTGNPHGTTKADIGLSSADNTSDADKPISTATSTALSGKVPTSRTVNSKALSADIVLTPSDVGADVAGAAGTVQANLNSHTGNTSNPHSVTKTQVSLGNVDDVQQLPLSYLDTDNTLSTNSDTRVPSQKAVKAYIDSSVGAIVNIQGNWNAVTNTPNISGTTHTGWAWRVSTAGTTNLGGITTWAVGDLAVKTTSSWMRIANTDIAAIWGNIGGTLANQTDLQNAIDAKADKTITVNGHAINTNVTVTRGDVGLGNCDNTSDINKPISTAQQTALDGKVVLNGFVNQTDSVVSMSGTNFQIVPAVTSYQVFSNGTKFVKSSLQQVAITNDNTLHYVYFDTAGVIQVSTTAWDITSDNIPIQTVYATAGLTKFELGEERHLYNRDRLWHKEQHNTLGTQYGYGLDATFTSSTLSITQGSTWDEDIQNDTGSTRTTANIWYRNAGGASFTYDVASSLPYKLSSGNLLWDNNGTLTQVTVDGNYVVSWVYSTNDRTNPISIVLGQAQYATAFAAQSAIPPSIVGFTTREWKLLYKVIFTRTSSSPVYVNYQDYRLLQTGLVTNIKAYDHSIFSNRDLASSHPATAISVVTSGFTRNLSATDLDLQTALSHIDQLTGFGAYPYAGVPGVNNDGVDTAGTGRRAFIGSYWYNSYIPTDWYRCVVNTTGAAVWAKITGTPVVLTSSAGALNIDTQLVEQKVGFYYVLTENITIQNPTNAYSGKTFTVAIRQHASASKTVALGTKFRVYQIALDVSPTLNSLNLLSFRYDANDDKFDLVGQLSSS